MNYNIINNKTAVTASKDGSSIFIQQPPQQLLQNNKSNKIYIDDKSFSIQGDAIHVPVPPNVVNNINHDNNSKIVNTRPHQTPPNAHDSTVTYSGTVLHTNINAAIMKSIKHHMHDSSNGSGNGSSSGNKELVRLTPLSKNFATVQNNYAGKG